MEVDYRVRTQIRECLEINFLKYQSQPFAAHIAFQLAFCYQIGFGVNAWLGCRIYDSSEGNLQLSFAAEPGKTDV